MDKYTVEYSVSQGCFHIDMLQNLLENNRREILEGNVNDYQLIGIVDNYEEANKIAMVFKRELELMEVGRGL